MAQLRLNCALSITDFWGSLRKNVLINSLKSDYEKVSLIVRKDNSSFSLGLGGVIKSGLSLVYVGAKGIKTEIILLFVRTRSVKEYKEGFRLIGVLGE